VMYSTRSNSSSPAFTEKHILRELQGSAHPTSLARREPWRTLGTGALDWFLIILAITALAVSPCWLHPFLLLLIATRQHALLVLMHESTHYLLCRNKALNDLAGDLLYAFPMGITTRAFRETHLAHHEHLNTAEDPDLLMKVGPEGEPEDWMFPLPIYRVVRLFCKDVAGKGFVFVFKNLRLRAQSSSRIRSEYRWPGAVRAVYYAFLIGCIVFSGKLWLILYGWLVPLLFILPALLRFRSVSEHFALPKEHVLNETRVIDAPWWETFLFAPHGICLHLDHHLFPYVPWYRLPELHSRLLKNEQYRSRAHINSSYLLGSNSVLADLTQIPDNPLLALETQSSVPRSDRHK
jgi:fatty acid desaturase